MIQSRRTFLRSFAMLTGVALTGCSSMRMLLDVYPEEYKYDKKLIKSILYAFVMTVIPGTDEDDPDLLQFLPMQRELLRIL